jgi:hypothetical protein
MTLWCLIMIVVFLSIQKMDAGRVGRIAVGRQDNLLTGAAVRIASFMAMMASWVPLLSATG